MTEKDRRYFIIAVFSVFLSIIFFYYAVYLPASSKLHQLDAAIASNDRQINAINDFATSHGSIEEFENKLFQENRFWQSKLPAGESETEFIAALQEKAYLNNITLLSIEPAEYKNQNEAYTESAIKLKIHSGYFQLLNFLRDLSELPRYNIVEKMNTARRDKLLESELFIRIFSVHK